VDRDWFTAADFTRWTTWGEDDEMATYLKIQVDGPRVTGDVYSLGSGAQAVDHFP